MAITYRTNIQQGSSSNIQASKTITAKTSQDTVTPDSGYDAMASVIVKPTPSTAGTGAALSYDYDYMPPSGKLFSKFTVTPQVHTETFSATTRNSKVDMGDNHNYKYVNTTGVPNANSGTDPTTITTNGKKDLGTSYGYRYINVNVPSSGEAMYRDVEEVYDGLAQNSGTYTISNRGEEPLGYQSVYVVYYDATSGDERSVMLRAPFNAALAGGSSNNYVRTISIKDSMTNNSFTLSDCKILGGSTTNNNYARVTRIVRVQLSEEFLDQLDIDIDIEPVEPEDPEIIIEDEP